MDFVRLATTKNPSLIDPPVDDRMLPLKDLALKSTKGSGVATRRAICSRPSSTEEEEECKGKR